MEKTIVKYNAQDIQRVIDILNGVVVQGIGNAQAIVAITEILGNKQVKDEEVKHDEQ